MLQMQIDSLERENTRLQRELQQQMSKVINVRSAAGVVERQSPVSSGIEYLVRDIRHEERQEGEVLSLCYSINLFSSCVKCVSINESWTFWRFRVLRQGGVIFDFTPGLSVCLELFILILTLKINEYNLYISYLVSETQKDLRSEKDQEFSHLH